MISGKRVSISLWFLANTALATPLNDKRAPRTPSATRRSLTLDFVSMAFISVMSSVDTPSTSKTKLVVLPAFSKVGGWPSSDFMLHPHTGEKPVRGSWICIMMSDLSLEGALIFEAKMLFKNFSDSGEAKEPLAWQGKVITS